MAEPLELTREQILAHRRSVQSLNQRLPWSGESLRRAAWAGLTDSMPRAALLSIHARVNNTTAEALDDASLVQLWGPRFSAYVVAEVDRAVFTLGRLPEDAKRRAEAQQIADRLDAFLDGRTSLTYSEVGRALGHNPNYLRYAAPTGRVLIGWDGAGKPTIRTVAPPAMEPEEAKLELARRYLHFLGPGTPEGFSDWAGVKSPRAHAAFRSLTPELVPARTPVGAGWILAADEPAFGQPPQPAAPARLLPSGDTYYLLQGAQRELLVGDAGLRSRLWTSRVWPGALLVGGEIAGTWRRADANVTIEPWRTFTGGEREAVEVEAASLPLPGLRSGIRVRWEEP